MTKIGPRPSRFGAPRRKQVGGQDHRVVGGIGPARADDFRTSAGVSRTGCGRPGEGPRLTIWEAGETDVTEKRPRTPPANAIQPEPLAGSRPARRWCARAAAARRNSAVTTKSNGNWCTNTVWWARSGFSAVSAAAATARLSSPVRRRASRPMIGMAAMPQAKGRSCSDHSGSGNRAYRPRQMRNGPGAAWMGAAIMPHRSRLRMRAPYVRSSAQSDSGFQPGRRAAQARSVIAATASAGHHAPRAGSAVRRGVSTVSSAGAAR